MAGIRGTPDSGSDSTWCLVGQEGSTISGDFQKDVTRLDRIGVISWFNRWLPRKRMRWWQRKEPNKRLLNHILRFNSLPNWQGETCCYTTLTYKKKKQGVAPAYLPSVSIRRKHYVRLMYVRAPFSLFVFPRVIPVTERPRGNNRDSKISLKTLNSQYH